MSRVMADDWARIIKLDKHGEMSEELSSHVEESRKAYRGVIEKTGPISNHG